MQTPSKIPSDFIYDSIVVGAGLSGLLVTAQLAQQGQHVLLIEAGESYGGQNHWQQTALGHLNNGLRFLPDLQQTRDALSVVENLLQRPLSLQTAENHPLTFESGGLRPFVGFGDSAPAFYEQLAYFLHPLSLTWQEPLFAWMQELFNKTEAHFLNRSYVTRYQGDQQLLQSVLINGQKTVRARNFIHCGSLRDLALLLPAQALNAKVRQKLAKAKLWTALGLDLLHSKPVTESSSIHLLNGTGEDELGPCLGQFGPVADQGQISQWISFLNFDDAEDTEVVGLALKKIKRQIKRVYPEALNHLQLERIVVAPDMGGNASDLGFKEDGRLPSLSNFWSASGLLTNTPNLLGCLLQAEKVGQSVKACVNSPTPNTHLVEDTLV